MSNCECIGNRFGARCPRDRVHQPVLGVRAEAAQLYSDNLILDISFVRLDQADASMLTKKKRIQRTQLLQMSIQSSTTTILLSSMLPWVHDFQIRRTTVGAFIPCKQIQNHRPAPTARWFHMRLLPALKKLTSTHTHTFATKNTSFATLTQTITEYMGYGCNHM